MNTYRFHANRQPDVAADRKDLADMYRRVRRHSPTLARELWRRMKNAQKLLTGALIDRLYRFGSM
jgi:hypothetical protein